MKRIARISLVTILVALVITAFSLPVFAETTLQKPAISSISAVGTTFTVKAKAYAKTTGYQIKYSTSSKFTKSKYIRIEKTREGLNKTVVGLKPNTKYYVRIQTYKVIDGERINSPWSSYRTVKTALQKPKISSISASGISFTVKAKAYAKATGYQIKYSTSSDFTKCRYIKVKAKKGLNKTVAKLKSNTKYYVRIRTYRSVDGKNVNSPWSSYRTVKTTLPKPEIASLSQLGTSFTVKAKPYANITGYQIKYSTSEDFANSRYIRIEKTSEGLNKTVVGLAPDTKYYVRIQLYKGSNDKRVNSAWSLYRTVTTPEASPFTTGYTTERWTKLYCERSTKSSYFRVWYNTKLTKIKNLKETQNGMWKSVVYTYEKDGIKYSDTYYLYETKGQPKLSASGSPGEYASDSPIVNEVLQFALDINTWDTKYDYSKDIMEGDFDEEYNRYPFDCSGYVSYVFNQVMQEYSLSYRLRTSVSGLVNQADDVVGYDLSDEPIISQTVCEGTPDYSLLEPGDVLFFMTKENRISHVGIYLGNEEFIHSTSVFERYPGDKDNEGRSMGGVDIAPMKGYYTNHFIMAVRFIPLDYTN